MTIQELIDAYWSWAIRNRAKSTVDSRRWLVQSLYDHMPRAEAESITPLMVEEWLYKSGITNPNTANQRITILSSVFKWGVAYRLIETNPIDAMPRPGTTIREFFIPPDRFQDVLDAAPDRASRDLVAFMLDTGCRVQELPFITAANWDGDGRFTLLRPESKGRRTNRVIILGNVSKEIARRSIACYPEGPCLRTKNELPWGRGSLYRLMKHLRTALGMPDLVATTFRHSFAHAKISHGTPPEIVAKLLGHANTNMVYTRYGHLIHSPIMEQNAGLL